VLYDQSCRITGNLIHGISFTSFLPEQAMWRARLNLPISVARRDRRWLRLTCRSLNQCGCTVALPRTSWRSSRHHFDARALSRRVESLLEQTQDQSDVAGHWVFQRRHLPRQLVDPGIELLHRPTRATLKVAWKNQTSSSRGNSTWLQSKFLHSSPHNNSTFHSAIPIYAIFDNEWFLIWW